MTSANIDIALATWNGERYLPAMLESIAAQTFGNWRLVVRDDGSTDGTCAIVDAFARRFPGKVEIVKDGEGRLGAAGNFAAAAKVCDAAYVAFADQDDVWLPRKLELAMAGMVDSERQLGAGVPVVVHTDLRVVDEALNEIAPSFIRHMRLDPVGGAKLERLVVRNIATGCTMLCNRALVDMALPVPSEAPLHDWWFVLVGACFGAVVFINEATVLYRQHAANVVGAGGAWSMRRWGTHTRARERTRRRYAQARGVSAYFGGRLSPQAQMVLDNFAALEHQGLWTRTWRIFTKGYRDHGFVRTAAAALLG
ncbi:rhamnosyltransferase [Burkholderia multivorans]